MLRLVFQPAALTIALLVSTAMPARAEPVTLSIVEINDF